MRRRVGWGVGLRLGPGWDWGFLDLVGVFADPKRGWAWALELNLSPVGRSGWEPLRIHEMRWDRLNFRQKVRQRKRRRRKAAAEGTMIFDLERRVGVRNF
uniref:Uncharacterized protein n=1 Tax=Opuntia streptacantha TaxID=393608 RepID=A0A7C8ZLS3_OPUST